MEDQRLKCVRQTHRFQTADDLARLLGCPLPRPFHTGQLAQRLHVERWIAQRIAYCFRQMGVKFECLAILLLGGLWIPMRDLACFCHPLFGCGGQQSLKPRLDLMRRQQTDEVVHYLAVAKAIDGGNALDAELSGGPRHLLRVGFHEDKLACRCHNKVFKHRREHATWCTPFGPEVDNNRDLFRSLDYVLLEPLVRRFDDPLRCT